MINITDYTDYSDPMLGDAELKVRNELKAIEEEREKRGLAAKKVHARGSIAQELLTQLRSHDIMGDDVQLVGNMTPTLIYLLASSYLKDSKINLRGQSTETSLEVLTILGSTITINVEEGNHFQMPEEEYAHMVRCVQRIIGAEDVLEWWKGRAAMTMNFRRT